MTRDEANQFFELLMKFYDAIKQYDFEQSCHDVTKRELCFYDIEQLVGYVAYCVADESSFADAGDALIAKKEAAYWIK